MTDDVKSKKPSAEQPSFQFISGHRALDFVATLAEHYFGKRRGPFWKRKASLSSTMGRYERYGTTSLVLRRWSRKSWG
jgi:hypothetical protein